MSSGESQIYSLLFYRRTRRMSKSINKAQSDMLLEKMVENPDIAKGFTRENKEKVTNLWKQLALSLNSLGPPVKTEFEWKKVWSDQKRYVRKKASQNKIHARGTGGGPNKTVALSSAEETIYRLLDLKDSFDGVEDSHRDGPAAKRAKTDSEVEILADILLRSDDTPGCNTDTTDSEAVAPQCESADLPSECQQNDISAQPVPQSTLSANKKLTTTELVLKELEKQQQICDKLGEMMTEKKSHNEVMQDCASNINRTLDRVCDLKERKLLELTRHNIEMEKMRKKEVEELIDFNRRELELKELKIEILKKNKD